MQMKRNLYWSLLLAGLVLGVVLSVQLYITRDIRHDEAILRTQELAGQVEEMKKEQEVLQAQLLRMRGQLEILSTGPLASQIKEEIAIFTGVTSVAGSGVEVTLEDSSAPPKLTENPNFYLVHDEDILKVVNELKAAGAEAIAVNDQRLIATSAISCNGPVIRINNKPLAPPFVITAIGNPDIMEGALEMRGGVVEYLRFLGLQASIKKLEQVQVPAYSSGIKPVYIAAEELDAGTDHSVHNNVYETQMVISDLSTEPDQAGIEQREADEALNRELAKMKQFAGLSPVSGPGVELVAQGRPGQSGSGIAQVSNNVADEHLLKIVNELYSAGSEAIAINGQRITAGSEIRLSGSHINVNGTPLSPPYRITAIGDASVLKSRLELKGGLVESLGAVGVSVEVQEKSEVEIPAFTGDLNFDHARPLKEN